MGTLTRDCPHCRTKRIGFTAFSAVRLERDSKVWLTSLFCGSCHSGYIVEVQSNDGTNPFEYSGNIEYHRHYDVRKEYPKAKAESVPEYLPQNIANFFLQAKTSLSTQNFDASAIMSRKVLEVSVKKIHPESNGSLYKRIEQLASDGLITNDLKEWAHIIREER